MAVLLKGTVFRFVDEMSLYTFCSCLFLEFSLNTHFSLPSAHFLRMGLVLTTCSSGSLVGGQYSMKVNSTEGYPVCGSMPGLMSSLLATGQ